MPATNRFIPGYAYIPAMEVKIVSPNLNYTREYIEAQYVYHTTVIEKKDNETIVKPRNVEMKIRTSRRIPQTGVMLIGWGGNNGSTFTAGLLANKHEIQWNTSKASQNTPNWYGSITQSATMSLGFDQDQQAVHVPMKKLVPMLEPDELIVDGWDISSLNLAEAMTRAQVIDYDLQTKLYPYMKSMKPRPAVYYPEYIAANQDERADNIMQGTKWEHVKKIQTDIRDFKAKHDLDQIILVWTANTEKFSDLLPGINDTADNLISAIKADSPFVAPSTIYAVAAVFEGCTFINGSPQNTFVPGFIQLAEERGVFLAGDDFKSGQTKLKSVLVDFLISAGLKPLAIASYNHLGNNDGFNLSCPQQFRSKEVSKTNVIDDMVRSNPILYKEGEKPDHCVVIKYMPAVGDSKRAMDEYTSELMLGGRNTLVIHNTCEDSLLAAPIILDLVIIAELMSRIEVKFEGETTFGKMDSILSVLGYLCKAPLVPKGTPVINSLFKQRACIENILRACLSLPPESNMLLEFKLRNHFTLCQNSQ